MKYEQILTLLEKGLSPADISQLSAMPDLTDPAPAAEPAPSIPEQSPVAPQPETAPAWATELKASVDRMTNAMHASAIMREQQPEVPKMTAEQALASVLEPPKKG